MIRAALKSNHLLSAALSVHDMDIFVKFAEFKEVVGGTVIIKQNDVGDLFYVAESGNFTVTVDSKSSLLPSHVKSFGEMALLFNAPRGATITASSHAKLWTLDRVTFRHGIAAATAKKREAISSMLAKVELLQSLTSSQLEHLADAVIPQNFAAGQLIIEKGQTGDVFYIIAEGEFLLRDVAGHKGPDIVKGPGSYFGEMALLTGDLRNATVVAKSAGKLLALSRCDFDSKVGPLKSLVEMSTHREMLQEIDILKNLDDTERMNAVKRFVPVTFKTGQNIIKEGAPGDAFFVISGGTVAISKAEHPNFSAEMTKGQFFGEMALLNRHDKRSATVTAKTNVKAYMLTRAAFQEIVVGDVAEVMKASAAERLAKQKESSKVDISFDDLKTIAMLGAGTFGRVSLVQDKNNPKNM
jgi:CRP-like cAMP-binding protein